MFAATFAAADPAVAVELVSAEGDRFEDLLEQVERRGTHPWAAADDLLGPD